MSRKRESSGAKREPSNSESPLGLPEDIAAIFNEITAFFELQDDTGRKIGNAKYGVYAFYDYDEEPIYVGQTYESLRVRIRRHLTNQRTDAVAMNVLDPFEVCAIEVWPLDDRIVDIPEDIRSDYLDRAEFTVFKKVVADSALGAVLNEKEITSRDTIDLPKSFRRRIIPEEVYVHRRHPDVRIARRASTIASLARVISERDVSNGLRCTLLTQARRLERLAAQRVSELGISSEQQL